MMHVAPVREIAAATAGALVTAAWAGVVLTAALVVCLRMCRGLSAGVRSAVWTTGLVLVVMLPVGVLLMPHRAAMAGRAGAVEVSADWALGLVCGWLVLVGFRVFSLLGSALELRRVAGRATPVTADAVCEALLRTGGRTAELCVSGDVDRPSVVGFLRPRVLIPAALFGELPAAEIEQIVRHEMEHLHRRDDWTNLLQKVSLAVFPLHPAVFWLDRQMCLERELACDDGVLRQTRAPKAYAACLANLAEGTMLRRRGSALALGAWERQSELSRRVYRILRWNEGGMSRRAAGAVAGLLLMGATAGSVELARAPQVLRFGDATPLAMAEVRPVDAVRGSGMLPVMARMDAGAGGARMVSADLRSNEATMPSSVLKPSVSRGRKVRRAGGVDRVERVRRTMPRLAADASRVVRTAWGNEVGLPEARWVLTVADEDQVRRYAAIATSDGWLVVQL